MSVQYAVLVLGEGGRWSYAAGHSLITGDPEEARWFSSLGEADAYAARRARSAKAVQIVKRRGAGEFNA